MRRSKIAATMAWVVLAATLMPVRIMASSTLPAQEIPRLGWPGNLNTESGHYVPLPEQDPAFREFMRDKGAGWVARVNPLTGRMRSVIGSGPRICDGIASLDEAEYAAQGFLKDYSGIFGVPAEDLRASYRASAGRKWSVHFSQYVGDWRVVGVRAFVVLTTSGHLVAFGADTYPDARDVAAEATGLIDIREAVEVAATGIGLVLTQEMTPWTERVILPMVSDKTPGALKYVRAYRIRLLGQSPPSCTDSYVDASTGSILWRRDLGADYSYVGKIRGDVDWPDRCSATTEHFPFDGMQVDVSGGPTLYCDTAGVFHFTDTRSQVPVFLSFRGQWADMAYKEPDDGVEATSSTVMQPGSDTTYWNWRSTAPHQAADHERDVFAYINRAHTWFTRQFPEETLLDRRVICYLNYNSFLVSGVFPGRARYIPGIGDTIYFSAAGEEPGGGRAYADIGRLGTVAVHEYGHMLTQHLYGGMPPDNNDLNEANSHIFSNLVLADSVVGRGACTTPNTCNISYWSCPWYTSNNTKTFPDSLELTPPMPQVNGLILSGVYWDAWRALESGLPASEAETAIARAWHRGRKLVLPQSMPDQVESAFIGDDDDDTLNLDNGTPHFEALCTGAENHGFECPPLTSYFTNVAIGDLASPGGQSPAWGDIDDDGDLDLYLVSPESPARLFRNDGPGALIHVSVPALEVGEGSRSASWGDYDGDGDVDLYVVTSDYCRLFRNDAGGAWADVTTPTIGVNRGVSASWVDFDNDGDLDICLVREWFGAHKLFRNDGGGGFADVGGGVFGSSPSGGQAWGDYDDDGDLDVYICHTGWMLEYFANSLFRNDGNLTFSNVTTEVLGGGARCSWDCAWGDYDNDGDLDLVVANVEGGSNMLLRNDDGTFVNVTPGCLSGYSASVAWGDMDNDGDLDLFASGIEGGVPTEGKLLMNNGDDGFVDESSAALKGGRGPGCSWIDYDDDRDLDLFVASYEGLNKLFENRLEGIDDQQLLIRAMGGASSSPSVGARVRVWEDGVRQMREISGGRSGGHDPQEARFGLGPWGSSETVDSVTVTWPSGAVQRRHGVPSGVLKIGELDPDSCLVALNDSVIACPGGDAVPSLGHKYLEITVTLKDGDGDPLVGVPPDLISVYVSGVSRYVTKRIVFCPDSISTIYQAIESTDGDGQTVIRDSTLGGCGYIYVDSVRVGARTFAVSDSAEIRSPDFTGDGLVNFLDTNLYLPDLDTGCALCGDLTYSSPCFPPPPKGQVNFTDTNKYIPHMITGCDCSNPGKLAVGTELAKNTQPHSGRPRLEVSRVLGDAAPGKAAGSATVEARVVVEDLSPVSAIHFDLGFEPGRAEFVGAVVEDLYSDYRVWGPFVREDRNVVDLMVSTNRMGEVVSGNVLIATLRFSVSDGTASPVWLESFHTSDAQWNLDTLYSAEPGGNELVFGVDFVGVAPNPFNPTTEIRFTTGVAGQVDLVIYDVSGRRVRSLLSGESLGAGVHSATWDGRNDSGQETGSGIYFCRISGREGSSVRRLVLVR